MALPADGYEGAFFATILIYGLFRFDVFLPFLFLPLDFEVGDGRREKSVADEERVA